jgi:hypothetical protein
MLTWHQLYVSWCHKNVSVRVISSSIGLSRRRLVWFIEKTPNDYPAPELWDELQRFSRTKKHRRASWSFLTLRESLEHAPITLDDLADQIKRHVTAVVRWKRGLDWCAPSEVRRVERTLSDAAGFSIRLYRLVRYSHTGRPVALRSFAEIQRDFQAYYYPDCLDPADENWTERRKKLITETEKKNENSGQKKRLGHPILRAARRRSRFR